MSIPEPKRIPYFGILAVRDGHLTEEQVLSLLRSPLDTSEDDGSVAMANLCLKKGLLTPVQIQQVLLFQNYHQIRAEDATLGELVVKRGIVSQQVVDYALDAQAQVYLVERQLPPRLGMILVEAEVLTMQKLGTLLADLARQKKKPVPLDTHAIAPIRQRPVPAPTKPGTAVSGWLIMEFGHYIGRQIPLGLQCVIGRPPHGDVTIPDPRISRRHARIEIHPANKLAIITDLKSRNGTFVNHRRIDGSVVLSPSDVIRTGLTVLRYEPADAPPEALKPRTILPPAVSQLGGATVELSADMPGTPAQVGDQTVPMPVLPDLDGAILKAKSTSGKTGTRTTPHPRKA